MQYAASIDDFARIMRDGNNGGYANAWLVADTNTDEIARLELGLKNVTLERTKDGYFVGANFPVQPKLRPEETELRPRRPLAERQRPPRALGAADGRERRARSTWRSRKAFVADHYDAFEKKKDAPERAHAVRPRRPLAARHGRLDRPVGANGTVQSKAADAVDDRARWRSRRPMGHACGITFRAAEHLATHPELAWQKPLLRDLVAYPWTPFRAEP